MTNLNLHCLQEHETTVQSGPADALGPGPMQPVKGTQPLKQCDVINILTLLAIDRRQAGPEEAKQFVFILVRLHKRKDNKTSLATLVCCSSHDTVEWQALPLHERDTCSPEVASQYWHNEHDMAL